MLLRGVLIVLLFGTSLAPAQRTGTFDFLRLDMNARAAALNGSVVSMMDDPNLLLYNPSALATLEQASASAGFLKHLLDVNAGSVSYAQAISDLGTFGAAIVYVDYGSFDRTDESMNTLGTFAARELAVVLGWGTSVEDDLFAGASLEFIHSSIAEYSSSALAAGAGILYRIPSENITIGASLLHAGTQLTTYDGARESLPLSLTIGITKRPEHLPVYLNLNFHKLTESGGSFLDRLSAFTFGAEFLVSESTRLRVGYDHEKTRELKIGDRAGLAGFALGGGVLLGTYRLDYAYNSYGKIGGLHRLTIGMIISASSGL